MADFSNIKAKINDLKAKIVQGSINPNYLGSILDDMVGVTEASDMSGYAAVINEAVSNARTAVSRADGALSVSNSALNAVKEVLTELENLSKTVCDNHEARIGDLEDARNALEQSEVLPFVAVIEGSEDIHDFHSGKEGYYYSTEEGFFFYCNEKKQVSKADEPYNVSAGLGQVGGSAPGSKVANKSRLYQSAGKLYYFEGGELVESNSIADSPDIVYSAETRQLSITEAAKRALFNDLWDEAWGANGGYKPNEAPDKSKPYKAYDLWLTYEEAIAVYDLGYITNQNLNSRFLDAKVRTTLPSRIKLGIAQGQYVWQNSSVEVINATLLVPNTQCFQNCKQLRRITNIYSINANAAIDTAYKGCVALESIELFDMVYRQNFSLADSPLLNLTTFQRIVNKTAASGNQFTITVAPNIFDALLGEGDEWPVNGGTKEEWAKVLTDAQAKNITFATA